MDPRRQFGRFLKRTREDHGVTQHDVAIKLGYTGAQFVSNVERGVCFMPAGQIKSWAKEIGMDSKDLFRAYLKAVNAEMKAAFEAS